MRAMILAAGRGERMRPLTDTMPKPLLPVRGKPLIVWHIERLAAAGIHNIIINHAWLGMQIEQTLGTGRQYGVSLHYSAENTALETAGGIAKALSFFQDRPFLVINGDIWCDWNARQSHHIAQELNQRNAQAWLLLADNPAHNPLGDFVLADPSLTASLSPLPISASHCKPAISVVQARPATVSRTPCLQTLTFTGIGIYQPKLFAGIVADQPAPLGPLLRRNTVNNQVIGTHHQGVWTDVGTPERLRELQAGLS